MPAAADAAGDDATGDGTVADEALVADFVVRTPRGDDTVRGVAEIETEHGALMLRDGPDGGVIAVYPPGGWWSCRRIEDDAEPGAA